MLQNFIILPFWHTCKCNMQMGRMINFLLSTIATILHQFITNWTKKKSREKIIFFCAFILFPKIPNNFGNPFGTFIFYWEIIYCHYQSKWWKCLEFSCYRSWHSRKNKNGRKRSVKELTYQRGNIFYYFFVCCTKISQSMKRNNNKNNIRGKYFLFLQVVQKTDGMFIIDYKI